MNIFLPYDRFYDCASTLDDRRLTKQILECKQIITIIEKKHADPAYKSPYLNHPVIQHYFNSPNFIVNYALAMCREFKYRFNHEHSYLLFFDQRLDPNHYTFDHVSIIYAAGSKYSPSCIRETRPNVVHKLFKEKLIRKWLADKEQGRPAGWTRRPIPNFYEQFLSSTKKIDQHDAFNELKEYAQPLQKQAISARLQFMLDNNDFILYDIYDELNRWIRSTMPDIYNQFIENHIRRTIEND